jgi:4,5-DOPA dioxygenase extradiol
MVSMLPAIFVSHGAPTLPLDACPAREFLKGLGATIERPKAILVVSAHWETEAPAVNSVDTNATIHDFYGFPEPLYRIAYPAPGSAALAERTQALLTEARIPAGVDRERGLDHGAWVPLMLMYPEADIPALQLSIQTRAGAEYHLKLGRALTPLRAEGVLILGSGGFVHNLRTLARGQIEPEPGWAHQFAGWIDGALMEGRTAHLVRYRDLAPYAVQAHPTEDHFLPLFVALGAGGQRSTPKHLHQSTTFGSLRMDAYAFS